VLLARRNVRHHIAYFAPSGERKLDSQEDKTKRGEDGAGAAIKMRRLPQLTLQQEPVSVAAKR
jgi:hypothetical protein